MRKITVKEDPALTARVGAMVPTARDRDPRRRAAHLERGRRRAGFPGPADDQSGSRKEVPRQRGQALAPGADGRVLQDLWALDRTQDIAALLGKLSVQSNS